MSAGFPLAAGAGFPSRMAGLGAGVVSANRASPESLRVHVASEIAPWTPINKKAGVCAD
jgi:hypothetical protein